MSLLFLSTDLMFVSRVSGRAQALGVPLSIVSDGDQLIAKASTGQPDLVLLDLTTPGLDATLLVPRLRRLVHPPKRVVAFGPHVHETKLHAARQAGCDAVLARGEFNARMAEVLESVGNPQATNED